MERHALAFRVRRGSEEAVASLLSDYDPPALDVDDGTRLLATAVFMQGALVVRNVEIGGDIGRVSRHIASDPRVRRIESQLAPHLEEPYDPTDPVARQGFFRTRLMERVVHVDGTSESEPSCGARRIALRYPVTLGSARRLAAALTRGGSLPLVATDLSVRDATLFVQGDHTLVQVLTVDGWGDGEALSRALEQCPTLDAVRDELAVSCGAPLARTPGGSARLLRGCELRTLLQRERRAAA
jgi:hypothetical protein